MLNSAPGENIKVPDQNLSKSTHLPLNVNDLLMLSTLGHTTLLFIYVYFTTYTKRRKLCHGPVAVSDSMRKTVMFSSGVEYIDNSQFL